MRARLVSDDPDLIYVRTVTVRVGDEVEVLRGDFSHPNSVKSESRGKRLGQARGRAGVKSKIVGIDSKMIAFSSKDSHKIPQMVKKKQFQYALLI